MDKPKRLGFCKDMNLTPKATTEMYRGIKITIDGWGVKAEAINCFCGTIQACKARIDELHAGCAAKGLKLA